MQGEVLQHIVPAVGVAEGHVPELDVPLDRLPVLPLGVECVAVFLHHLGGVGDLGLFLQQAGDPLDGCLDGDELRQICRQVLDGLENVHGVGDERGQGGNVQHLPHRQVPAPEQHDGHRQGREKQRHGNIHRVEPRRPHRRAVHAAGELPEALDALVLDHQGFGGLGPGDSLVEGPGDLGVDFPHLPGPVENPGLEPARQRRHEGHHQNHHQGQLPVQQKHGGKGAGNVEQRVAKVHQAPGDVAGNAVGVVGNPGQQIAHRGNVVKGQGQGLQVLKQVLAQIPAHIHLNVHGLTGADHHNHALEQDGAQVNQHKGGQPLQRPRLDKVADGVLLEQGEAHVHQGGQGKKDNHAYDGPPEPGQNGQQALPNGPVKGLGIFFFVKGGHYACPPSWTSARSSLLIWMS